MTQSEKNFLILLLINAIVSVIYLIGNILIKKDFGNVKKYLMNMAVMLLCPIVGIVYFLFSYLKYRFVKIGKMDLSDVEFSKKRHFARVKADENRERNIVSVGEAIFVSDKEKKRANMLNVLLCDTDESYSAIALALDSDDSEVAHYAASFLQSKLDTFRDNVRKTTRIIEQSDLRDEECQTHVLNLIEYINHLLKQKVFTPVEQKSYTNQMQQLCEMIYNGAKHRMTVDCYEAMIRRLAELKNYDEAELWCERFYEHYPNTLAAYTLKLKIYFETSRKTDFFKVLDQLKSSSVSIDNKTLELIRMTQIKD